MLTGMPAATRAVVTTLSGIGTYGYVDGTGATEPMFYNPRGVALPANANSTVFVVDSNNNRIRAVGTGLG